MLGLAQKTSAPVDLTEHLRTHIDRNFHDTHPDDFTNDYARLDKLRKTVVITNPDLKQEAHPSLLRDLVSYYAQLFFLASKFPDDPAFTSASVGGILSGALPTQQPVTLGSLPFERASVLFNIAAMNASLAAIEDRPGADSIKRSIGYFQTAAGVFEHLRESVIGQIKTPIGTPDPCSPDLYPAALHALQMLYLAQAQECAWQKAVSDRLRNGTIAKLSAQCSEYYSQALDHANAAKSAGGSWPAFSFPSSWINHVTIKKAHFAAAAQYRRSIDDLAANKYGEEIGRLRVAESTVKKALETSKRGVSSTLFEDLRGLQVIIVDNLTRATKDNDLIYLDPVVTPANLTPIAPVSLVKAALPAEIARPIDFLHDRPPDGLGRPCFESLVPYGVHLAISVYNDRKEEFVRSQISSVADELEATAASVLSSLNLPGSIQALEQPIGLPPSLLRKAEEVRSESGPSKIRSMLADVQRVAQSDRSILDEAVRTLNAEEQEDESKRAKYGTDRWTRQPSSIINASLRDRADKLKATLTQASDSDALVRRKYYDVEEKLLLLASSKDDLQDSVPSSTSGQQRNRVPATSRIVSELRVLLEQLEDLEMARKRIVDTARSVVRTDEIRPAIMRQAGTLPAHAPVSAADFEPLFESEMTKYGRFVNSLRDNGVRSQDLLDRIRATNETFVQTRKEDRTVKARQEALQSLDKAYGQYRELCSNLAEGLGFYASLGKMIGQVRDAALHLVEQRRQEAIELENALRPDYGDWDASKGIKFG